MKIKNFSEIFGSRKVVFWISLFGGTFLRKTYVCEKLTVGYMGRMWNVDKEEWQQNAMQYAVKYRRTWEAKNNYPQDTNRWNRNNKKKKDTGWWPERNWVIDYHTVWEYGNFGDVKTPNKFYLGKNSWFLRSLHFSISFIHVISDVSPIPSLINLGGIFTILSMWNIFSEQNIQLLLLCRLCPGKRWQNKPMIVYKEEI